VSFDHRAVADVDAADIFLAADASPQPRAARLRIAVVTPELHRQRGTERITSELVDRLAAEHEVHVFAHTFDSRGYPGVQFHGVRILRWPGLAGFLSFYAVSERALRRAARAHGAFDVVYSPGPNCSAAQVVTAHFCQARQLAAFRSGKHRPAPSTLLDRAKRINRWMYAWVVTRVERAFYSSSGLQRVLTPSGLLAEDLHREYALPREKATVAHPGVDTRTFSPQARAVMRARARAELGLGDADFAFLFLGNNWLIKGLYHALHALADVPEARLLIVGADYEPTASWRKLAQKLGVSQRVAFLPRRADVLFYYAAADTLLAPSVYDTFALMPLEAAACGLPSIITRSMGVAEVLREVEAVLLDTCEDHAALAGAMRALRQDAVLRERLGRAARLRAQQHSWDSMCSATLEALLVAANRG
jgi:UDP-glucose:(heptosyl)LPS alpha-1,3-glucosyltransferase